MSGAEADMDCKSVLVVDDEKIIIEVIEEIIGRSAKVFDTAMDGLEGYKKLLGRDYDCIFIDVIMPEMDGIELLRLIKQIKPHLLKKMIFFTGGIESEDVREMILSSGCRLIDKPFMVQELCSVVGLTLKAA